MKNNHHGGDGPRYQMAKAYFVGSFSQLNPSSVDLGQRMRDCAFVPDL